MMMRKDKYIPQISAPRNPIKGRKYENNASILCLTVSSIPARSGTTAGFATDVKKIQCGEDGELRESGSTVTVYNIFGDAVGAGKYITCKRVRTRWIVDAEDCS
jgi:hypothetical protein